MWRGTPFASREGQGVVFSYTSPDGDEGYPGTLVMLVTYTLTHGDELRIEYEAKLDGNDQSTPVNLTNHAYWNLAGAGSGTVLNHVLTLNADKYTVADDTLIPTGEIADVAGTPLDFRKSHVIGNRIPDKNAANTEECKTGAKGYDHNFVLNGKSGEMRLASTLKDPASGRVLEIHTVEPGIQFYSGNFLKGQTGKGGKTYPFRGAVCLETQHFPDSVNHANFPNTILKPGETYRTSTIHKFRVEE
jgi:aldose 1-epimerase